jgi:hypothetical protein
MPESGANSAISCPLPSGRITCAGFRIVAAAFTGLSERQNG